MIIKCDKCKAGIFIRHWSSEAVAGTCPLCQGRFQTAGEPREMGIGEVFALTQAGGLPTRSGRGSDSTAMRLALQAA